MIIRHTDEPQKSLTKFREAININLARLNTVLKTAREPFALAHGLAPKMEIGTMEPAAYTIQSFLKIFPISRTTLYAAWKENRGPRRITVGRRVLIPRESAKRWIQELLEIQEEA